MLLCLEIDTISSQQRIPRRPQVKKEKSNVPEASKRRSSRLKGNEPESPPKKSKKSSTSKEVVPFIQEKCFDEDNEPAYPGGPPKVYAKNGRYGTTCHQCRQKTIDKKTECSKCESGYGIFCGICLFHHYGDDIHDVLANPDQWVCPSCQGVCNCSICLRKQGRAPNGIVYRLVLEQGYKSVKDWMASSRSLKEGLLKAKSEEEEEEGKDEETSSQSSLRTIAEERSDDVSLRKSDDGSSRECDDVSLGKSDDDSSRESDDVSLEKSDDVSSRESDDVSLGKSDDVSLRKTSAGLALDDQSTPV